MRDEKHEALLNQMVPQILELCSPSKIIEYNAKFDLDGQVSSFKLCLVGNFPDVADLLRKIYTEIDTEVPFDVLFYTDEQFEDLKEDTVAFANRVATKGKVLYG